MDELDMNNSYCRNPNIVAAEMDGDFVMMNVESGEYYSIRGSGARIWDLAERPVTESEIVETLCDECEVDESTCRADVRKFLDESLEAGLIMMG